MKVVVEEDYLIADSLGCSRYVKEMGDLCRIHSNKVCVYCDRVQVSKTKGSEVLYRKVFHMVSLQ